MPAGRVITSDFKPAWWLPDPHSQTLWPYLFRRSPGLALRPERLELPDGDFVDLCWTTNNNGPLVIVLHGLEGDMHSPYARAILTRIHRLGWRGVFMHFRGCSGEPNRLDRAYHSGDTGDICYLFQVLRERYPATAMAAVGYSLGGNALLKYLGEVAADTPLVACVAVSVPYRLDDSADTLSQGISRLYQWRLVRSLRHKLRRKFAGRKPPFDIDRLASLNTFYKFDDYITSRLHGFSGADEYYKKSSCRQYLKRIRVPTLLLHARDDPFMSPAAIPSGQELSESVILELSDKGGHTGFVGGIVPWKPEYWLEPRITRFLNTFLA